MTTLQGWKYGFDSPFKCDVYYVTTRLFTGNKMGHIEPHHDARRRFLAWCAPALMARFDFRIVQPQLFLKEVAGSDQHFRLDEFADTMRSRVISLFSESLAQAKVPVLDVATRYSELGDALFAAH